MNEIFFESSEKRYSECSIPTFCYKILDGVISDKIVTVIPHWHNEMEILYADSALTLHIDDKRYDAEIGDVFFINPNEIHRAFRKTHGPIRSIVFDLSLLKTSNEKDKDNLLLDELIQGKKKFITKCDRGSELYSEIRSFFETTDEYAQKSIGYGAEKYKMLSMLYSIMAACIRSDFFVENSVEKHPGMRYVLDIVAYINNHYYEPLTAEYISKKFNISPSYLYALFNNFVGITPLQCVNSLRLKEAYRLLEEGASVTDSAIAVGFSDVSYFIKLFKNATGQTPSKWKKLKNKGGN